MFVTAIHFPFQSHCSQRLSHDCISAKDNGSDGSVDFQCAFVQNSYRSLLYSSICIDEARFNVSVFKTYFEQNSKEHIKYQSFEHIPKGLQIISSTQRKMIIELN